jgi:hypothetical protein
MMFIEEDRIHACYLIIQLIHSRYTSSMVKKLMGSEAGRWRLRLTDTRMILDEAH